MPSKRPGKRCANYDEFIASPPPTPTSGPPPETLQERHSEYAPRQRVAHSFLAIPYDYDPTSETVNPGPLGTADSSATLPVPSLSTDDDGDATASAEDSTRELEVVGLAAEVNDARNPKKRQRTQADHPLLLWVPHIEEYVSEFLRLEGHRDSTNQTVCAMENCSADIMLSCPGFRCLDCQVRSLLWVFMLYLVGKTIELLKKWTGKYFEKTSLKEIRFRVQLGHSVDGLCLLPERAIDDSFVIIDSDGVHEVGLDFWVNLPENWEQQPAKEQWLYSLFVGIDANFRLKRMNVSSDERDPGLNHGYAYMVENTKYEAYLREYGKAIQEEKSNCHNHDAIKSANIHGGRGTAASGLGTVECSRHDMKRPVSVGDLQKGEHYVNMDYFFLSGLRGNTLSRIMVSYDIACQWSKKRCSIYPENVISSRPELQIDFLVPKFHLPAHVASCQIEYSFNLIPGSGRTNGEAPERGWSAVNSVAASTREMGPGSRQDTLDDMFGDYNWWKKMAFAEFFLRKAEEAILAQQEHVEAFIEFDVALPHESADRTKPNPFQSMLSDAEVCLQLAEEDQEDLSKKENVTTHFSRITPSFFIYQGLEIEAQQRHLALEIAELGIHSTTLQHAKVLERSNALQRRIDAWVLIQHFYVPAIALVWARIKEQGGSKPVAIQDIDLFLPSQIHETVTYPLVFLRYEWQLHYARAHVALNDPRGQLLMRSMMYKSKERHSRGQHQQTWSMKLIENVSTKIDNTANWYRLIRRALISLSVPLAEVNWEKELRVLKDSDLLGLTSLDDVGPEGWKKLKWIWTVQGAGANMDASGEDALRVEWCKVHARAHRWQEECLLLQEEMRRVLVTFKVEAARWLKIVKDHEAEVFTSQQTLEPLIQLEFTLMEIVREGRVAYAYRQNAVRQRMLDYCRGMWTGVRERLGVMVGFNAHVLVEHSLERGPAAQAN
ncbi:unnamed protein product [Cyclocybe aegerita]|uniref:CxC2-like cysteine cluster KDZ transposase-associated domain-containing protein n=1 Tax=Cyclocybe aegerita TaxID=1973307 RepID=A0A8S0XD02_CYCAE|nr:unnamed protein product [Cyclocybe aegerita]